MQTRVCVVLTTYNHEQYIEEAIDSILMQEARFGVDLVILDDCSTDRTSQIVAAYQASLPETITVVRAEVNKCDNRAFMTAIQQCEAEYVAVLDGDDYWTSPDKLQKQVDYLDAHPDYAICFHDVGIIGVDGNQAARNSQPLDQKETSRIDDLLEYCFIRNCSALIRLKSIPAFPSWYATDKCPDWSLFVLTAQQGWIGYLNESMAVYRQHGGGFWTGQDRTEQGQRIIDFYEQLLDYLDERHAGHLKTLLAKQYYELAVEFESNGDRAAARRCFRRCLSVEPDVRRIRWMLRTAAGCIAQIAFPPDDCKAVRVAIERCPSEERFDIQLNWSHLRVKAAHHYTVEFRAKADRARTITVGFAKGYEPWSNLGLYQSVTLTSDWQRFEEGFIAVADEQNGRIHFDIGASDISVDLSSVILRGGPSDQPTEPVFD